MNHRPECRKEKKEGGSTAGKKKERQGYKESGVEMIDGEREKKRWVEEGREEGRKNLFKSL